MFLFLLLRLALASPLASVTTLHERRDVLPRGWIKSEVVPEDMVLPMRIGLTQNNLDKGYELLMDVSSHESPNYGKHYSPEEVIEVFAPLKVTIDSVVGWLQDEGIDNVSLSANKQWLQFDAEAGKASELLTTRFHVFEHKPTGSRNIACDEYHLPAHLREHIDYITPGVKLLARKRGNTPQGPDANTLEKRIFGVTNGKKGIKPPPTHPVPIEGPILNALVFPDVCDTYIIPECISALYNITNGTTAAAGNELGIFESLGDIYSQEDLDLFFENLAPYIPNGTHPTLDAIDGAVAPTSLADAGPESNLDFQISYPIIWPQNSVLYQTDDPVYEDDYTYEGFLNNFLDALDGSYCTYSAYGETGNSDLDPSYPDPAAGGYKGNLQCGVYEPTNVISISYGGQEADLPASYQQRQCNEFMKLGLQGVSVFIASGDDGVAGPESDDELGCLGNGTIFSPDFPATCPYVTAVGATYLPSGGDVYKDEEVAVSDFGSGGGFSNIYPIPSYQASATNPYYSSVNNGSFGADGGIYNRLGRGYPDVSAIGDNIVIYWGGDSVSIGGTSASSPTFAAIITRINEERLAANKTTVGFVNPVLYAHPEALHDITNGTNPGCRTEGFSASSGWDPVTGLGTPNYPALLEVFLSLP